MIRHLFLLLIFSVMMKMACVQRLTENPSNAVPPQAKKIDVLLSEHGQTRKDSYFWMRLSDKQKYAKQPDEKTQNVMDYLHDENTYTQTVMRNTEPLQKRLYNEIVARIKKDDASVPYFSNGYWYYQRYKAENEYPTYCRKKKLLEAPEEILLDINALAKNHEYYDISDLYVSPDNNILAFGEDTLSRRFYTIRFKNLKTGEWLDDQLTNTSGDGAWSSDSRHYFYTVKTPISLLTEKVFRHTLRQSTDSDALVHHEKDPSYYTGVSQSKSGKYIIIWSSSTLSSDYWLVNADAPKESPVSFSPREDEHEYEIHHLDDKFYILTNWKAKNFRLMQTSVHQTEKRYWSELIPHRPNTLLESIELFDEYMVIKERTGDLVQLRVRHLQSKAEHYIDFKESAYLTYIGINEEMNSKTLRYVYTSLTTPYSTYDYDMEKKSQKLKKRQEVVGGHTPSDYVTERIWATMNDGVQVPISMVYKKGIDKNGKNPLLLYGYGAYGNTIDPSFSATRLSLLDRGFIFAIAHVRGGQMMGRQWYEDGKMLHKKNTFNDFVGCSQHLIAMQYTSSDHLYAMGGSAGGLLMGVIANTNPTLYKGIIAAVPFVDVISTMWDETIPLTTNEFNEWGNPKELNAYQYMMSYSPYDNVTHQDYPHMLVTTGLFDSQVQYWEPAKWVAKLRQYKTDNNLLLLDVNMDAGHGGASGRFKHYLTTALEYAFMLHLEGMNIEKD